MTYISRRGLSAGIGGLFLVLTTGLAGCGSGVASDTTPLAPVEVSGSFRSMRFRLGAEDSAQENGHVVYKRGQVAHLVFSITNEGSTAAQFVGNVFPAQLIILKEGIEIWRIEYGQITVDRDRQTTDTSYNRTVAAGQTLEYHLLWPLADSNNRRVGAGEYQALAWFDAQPGTPDHLESIDARTMLTAGPLPITVR